jgi:hypothetical protein
MEDRLEKNWRQKEDGGENCRVNFPFFSLPPFFKYYCVPVYDICHLKWGRQTFFRGIRIFVFFSDQIVTNNVMTTTSNKFGERNRPGKSKSAAEKDEVADLC